MRNTYKGKTFVRKGETWVVLQELDTKILERPKDKLVLAVRVNDSLPVKVHLVDKPEERE